MRRCVAVNVTGSWKRLRAQLTENRRNAKIKMLAARGRTHGLAKVGLGGLAIDRCFQAIFVLLMKFYLRIVLKQTA